MLSVRRGAPRLVPFLLGPLFLAAGPAQAAPELVSANAAGTGSGLGASTTSHRIDSPQRLLSRDGSFVVFVNFATDLVGLPDVNGSGSGDVFVRDRLAGTTELVSINAAGTASGNGNSGSATISDNGRFVCFVSSASDLVPGGTDGNGVEDVYVRDRQMDVTTLVSVGTTGTSGNQRSRNPVRTPSGRFVAFQSRASNLVAAGVDGNGAADVYVRDLNLGTTTLASINPAGQGAAGAYEDNDPAISDDGRLVAFFSSTDGLVAGDVNGASDVFVRDLAPPGMTELVSVNAAGTASGNGHSVVPVMTPDGRFVAFLSKASNLAPGVSDTNGRDDLYVRDRGARVTRLVTVNAAGSDSGNDVTVTAAAALSHDGRYVAFTSLANDLVADIGDLPGTHDVFARDMVAGRTVLVSVNRTGGAAGNGISGGREAISDDGRLVTFASAANDLVDNDTNGRDDLYVRDRGARVTRLVTVNAAGSDSGNDVTVTAAAALSHDGRYVAFTSLANDLVAGIGDLAGTHDVFARDMVAGRTVLVSVNRTGGAAGNGISGGREAISDDGRLVTFASAAIDLVDNDTNGPQVDIFQRDLLAGRTFLLSGNAAGTGSGNRASGSDALATTRDGGLVLFGSQASDLVPNDSNGQLNDVFLAASAAVPPTLTLANCRVSPTSLAPTGGVVTLSVDVASGGPLARVFATITRPDATTTEVDLARGAGDTFGGTFTAPANALATVRTYGVAFTAVQVSGGRSSVTCAPFTVGAAGDSVPPTLTHFTVNPRAVSHRGGSISLKALVTDNVRVASVTVTFTLAGVSTPVTLLAVAGRGFVGSFPAPANPTSAAQVYSVSLTMRDRAGNSATVPGGEVTVAADNVPPALSAFKIDPGRTVTFRGELLPQVRVVDGGQVARVTANFTRGGELHSGHFLHFGGSLYLLRRFQLPTNTTREAQSYRIEVVATDAAGNRASLNGGSVTVLAARREPNRPQLPYCLISPTSLPAAGGEVTVMLVAVDDTFIQRLIADFIRRDGVATEVVLTQVEPGQPFYRGTFTAPANRTAEPQEHFFRAAAVDIWGNLQRAGFGTVTVAPAAP